MFVAPGQEPSAYNGKGIALSAVDPTAPTAVKTILNDKLSNRHDFTACLINKVMNNYERRWPPSYTDVRDILVPEISAKPVLYHDPSINPSELQFP